MRGHDYDALVGHAGCDKSLPGMMMAMCRLNVPAIFIYGGSILPGTFKGKPVTVQDVFEAVGEQADGEIVCEGHHMGEQQACAFPGARRGHATSHAMVQEPEPNRPAWPYPAGAPAP